MPIKFLRFIRATGLGRAAAPGFTWAALALFPLGAEGQPGQVYLVIGSDTAIWNTPTTVDVYTRHPHYSQESFTASNAPIFQVMNAAWRSQYRDSYHQTIKFTWWMMGGNIYRDADNLNVPVPNTMALHLMRKYHGSTLSQFGDELSLHYHTFFWSDYDQDGVYHWNQSRTFGECRKDWDVTLSQYLLEEGVFPASFRSGWHFMDAEWQQYLNTLIPFCFHDDFGAFRAWYTNEPIAGVEDWTRAPSSFTPFHPSTNDYQLPGDGPGWNVRSVKIQNLVQSNLNYMFAQAATGVDQVACLWTHLPENFVAMIAKATAIVEQASAAYPGVPFHYCTAVEAMQRWQGITNASPPLLHVQDSVQDQTVTLAISTDKSIFQPTPFVCLRDAFQRYTNLTALCVATGTNSWLLRLPVSRALVAKVGIAVTDPLGNVATQVIRYLPDDLYVDNLDPDYTEPTGHWLSTTNYAWGTDARIALLGSNDTAQARWSLPLTASGLYNIAAQVPSLTNACTNLTFTLSSGVSNIWSRHLPAGLRTNQWNLIGQAFLDASQSNALTMTASGSNQPNTYVAADVIAVVPVVYATNVPSADQLAAQPGPEGLRIQFSGQPGTRCQVQRTGNLSSNWTTLDTLSVPLTGLLEFEDLTPLNGSAFYRIKR